MTHKSALDSIRETYGRTVYSHKTHEKAAERLNRRISLVKWSNLILIVLTFGGVLNAVFEGGAIQNLLTVIVSALALSLAIYQMSFTPTARILEHRKTADQLWHLREQLANLIADIQDGVLPDEGIRSRRDDLTARLAQVYEDGPQTTPKDYRTAKKALGPGEEMTFSKEEIDRFLPSGNSSATS